MRMLSVGGGLWQRGVTEALALRWPKGVIFTKDMIKGIENFYGVSLDRNFEITQHIDASDAKISRSAGDMKRDLEKGGWRPADDRGKVRHF